MLPDGRQSEIVVKLNPSGSGGQTINDRGPVLAGSLTSTSGPMHGGFMKNLDSKSHWEGQHSKKVKPREENEGTSG